MDLCSHVSIWLSLLNSALNGSELKKAKPSRDQPSQTTYLLLSLYKLSPEIEDKNVQIKLNVNWAGLSVGGMLHVRPALSNNRGEIIGFCQTIDTHSHMCTRV